jgi:hypothetical protein
MAGFGGQLAITDISYTLASRYFSPRLFPIVVPGLRGRLIAGAQNKPPFLCLSV